MPTTFHTVEGLVVEMSPRTTPAGNRLMIIQVTDETTGAVAFVHLTREAAMMARDALVSFLSGERGG
jgi:hypothetical protein